MPYFFYFNARGHQALNDILGPNPFILSPSEIIQRVLAAGYKPVMGQPRLYPWPQVGETHKVENGGQTFFVTISQDEVEISVQEVRTNV